MGAAASPTRVPGGPRRGGARASIVALGLVLAPLGCALGEPAASSRTPSSSLPSGLEPAPATTPAPAPAAAEDVDAAVDDELPEPGADPTWDPAARDAATTTAREALSAYARPDVDQATWWAGLRPLLSDTAAAAYVTVDPARVPVRAVTGDPTLVDDTSPWLAGVTVPTDVGSYRVLLSRDTADAPWRVERFLPPDGTEVDADAQDGSPPRGLPNQGPPPEPVPEGR